MASQAREVPPGRRGFVEGDRSGPAAEAGRPDLLLVRNWYFKSPEGGGGETNFPFWFCEM